MSVSWIRSVLMVVFVFWEPTAMTNEIQKKFIKPSKEELQKKLTPEQYKCTQENGTEIPFHNKYWDYKEDGLYVDVVSGEPLFSSMDKFDSGSGWPSFTHPLQMDSLTLKSDKSLGVERTEVRSSAVDSHLGHVFDDGPKEAGGKRYCINSSSLNFVPIDQFKEKKLGKYLFSFALKKGWETATLGGGCFWGVEELIRNHPGVLETMVGYSGGKIDDPTYNLVKTGTSGHAEVVRVLFDPKKLKYEELLLLFFRIHDPTTLNQQGNDIGTQYRSVIFYESVVQKEKAEVMKLRVEKSGGWKKPILTEINALGRFWSAEDYHQKYLLKNPGGYTCHYMRDLKF